MKIFEAEKLHQQIPSKARTEPRTSLWRQEGPVKVQLTWPDVDMCEVKGLTAGSGRQRTQRGPPWAGDSSPGRWPRSRRTRPRSSSDSAGCASQYRRSHWSHTRNQSELYQPKHETRLLPWLQKLPNPFTFLTQWFQSFFMHLWFLQMRPNTVKFIAEMYKNVNKFN